MKTGDRVRVEFEVEVTDIHDNDLTDGREFFSGRVDLGRHERMEGQRKTAFVAGIPISKVVR